MVLSSSAEALQKAIEDMAQARKYVWDGPYDEVARWEASALAAVREAFGEESAEFAELSAAVDDRAWKDTNRPDAVAPEVFVNNDFQRRMDRLEAMLKGYLQKLQGTQEQSQQAAGQVPKPMAKKRAPQAAGRKKKAEGRAKRKAPAATKRKKKGKKGGRKRTSAAAAAAKPRKSSRKKTAGR